MDQKKDKYKTFFSRRKRKKITTSPNGQHPLPVATYWLRAENHDLLLSEWEADRLKPDLEHLAKWFRKFRSTVHGTKEGLVSGAPMQRLELSFTEENRWQLRLRNEDPRGEIRLQWKSGLQNGVVSEVGSGPSPEHVQNERDKLVLAISLTNGFVPGSLTNETMPFRQRGQAIEPRGHWETVELLFMEQRYKAHFVQNSWSQPAPWGILRYYVSMENTNSRTHGEDQGVKAKVNKKN